MINRLDMITVCSWSGPVPFRSVPFRSVFALFFMSLLFWYLEEYEAFYSYSRSSTRCDLQCGRINIYVDWEWQKKGWRLLSSNPYVYNCEAIINYSNPNKRHICMDTKPINNYYPITGHIPYHKSIESMQFEMQLYAP
jgi:hypothetical protein